MHALLDLWPYFALFGEMALKIALICFILTRRSLRPTTALAWIVIMFALPALGMVLYLLIGETRLGKRRIRRHREILGRIQTRVGVSDRNAEHKYRFPWIAPQYIPVANLAESVTSNPVRPGNALRLIGDSDLFVQSLVEDIDAAERYCHLLYYIYLSDHSGRRVGEALIRAAQRGVHCRLLVDSVGSRLFLNSHLCRQLRDAGVRVVEALPASALRIAFARIDLRNHRKIAVIDDRTGYMGSQNLADPEFALKPRFAPWVDAVVRIDGPATRDLHALFVEDWFLDTNESLAELLDANIAPIDDGAPAQVMGTGPNSNNEALRMLITEMTHAAREELILTTPYFVPDESTLLAVDSVARRGVETTLVVPARNDSPLVAAASRSFYERLLCSGVKIVEFTGGLLHAKTLTVDRSLALVSTANIDRRSLDLNFEVSIVVYDSDFASELRFLQKTYMNNARTVQHQQWGRRPWLTRLGQNAAGLLGPLL